MIDQMVEPILAVSGLTVQYGALLALKEVSLSAHEDEILAIAGPNGAGKTTLLESIAGIRKIKKGEIRYSDKRIENLSVFKRRGLGIILIPQEENVFPRMSVRKNLEVGGLFCDEEEKETLIEYVYELFPRLKERKNQRAETLSGGEQKMLAVGLGLVSSADFLLVDEPSIGLAPKLVTELFARLKQIKDETNMPVMLAEQNIKILDITDRVYGLEAGETKFCEKTEKLDKDQVKDLYMGMEVGN